MVTTGDEFADLLGHVRPVRSVRDSRPRTVIRDNPYASIATHDKLVHGAIEQKLCFIILDMLRQEVCVSSAPAARLDVTLTLAPTSICAAKLARKIAQHQ